MSSINQIMMEFMAHQSFAVVGASTAREKYGNRVLRWYIDHSKAVVPINPNETTIENLPVTPNLSSLSNPSSYAISVITPPVVTLRILQEAHDNNIGYVWLQPGAESAECKKYAHEVGIKLVSGGPCILKDGPAILAALERGGGNL